MVMPNLISPGFAVAQIAPNLIGGGPLKIPTTLNPSPRTAAALNPPPPQTFGQRVQGLLSSILGAEGDEEYRRGLLDFGIKMLGASAQPGATLGGALGQALPATRQGLVQQRQLSALNLAMDPRFRGLPPEIQAKMLEPYTLGAGQGRYVGREQQAYQPMPAEPEVPYEATPITLGGGDVVLADTRLGSPTFGEVTRIEAPEEPDDIKLTWLEDDDLWRGVDERGNTVKVYPRTMVDESGMSPEDLWSATDSLRREFNSKDAVENYNRLNIAYNSLKDSRNDPTAVADLDYIFAIAKALDPTSVVREGEQETLRKAQGMTRELMGQIDKAIDGSQQLLPEAREALFRLLERRLRSTQDQVQELRQEYITLSGSRNLPWQEVVGYIWNPAVPGRNPLTGR